MRGLASAIHCCHRMLFAKQDVGKSGQGRGRGEVFEGPGRLTGGVVGSSLDSRAHQRYPTRLIVVVAGVGGGGVGAIQTGRYEYISGRGRPR